MHYPTNFRGVLGGGEVMMYVPGDTRQDSRISYALCVCWLSMVQATMVQLTPGAVSSALSICFPYCKGSGHTRLTPPLQGELVKTCPHKVLAFIPGHFMWPGYKEQEFSARAGDFLAVPVRGL